MITIYGPSCPRRIDRRKELGEYEPYDEKGFSSSALSLKAAITDYENEFQIRIEKYDGTSPGIEIGDPPKYFYYNTGSNKYLVDIHINRDGQEICPKQNLNFALLDGDIITIGQLVC